jgi:hypothetical protein
LAAVEEEASAGARVSATSGSFQEELISGGLLATRFGIPPDSRAVEQLLCHYSGSLQRIFLRDAPSGASPAALRQDVIKAGIDMEVEVDIIAFMFLL